MKLSNTLRILCILYSFFTLHSSYSQNVPSYVPTNGLVGWWPFNGNANDESGNGNHGTVYGASLIANRSNQISSAYYFNGNRNYIEIPDLISIRNSAKFSLSYWVKLSTNDLGGVVFNQWLTGYGGSNENLGLQIGSGSNVSVCFLGGCPGGVATDTNLIIKNNWTHVVFVFDGAKSANERCSFYVNGIWKGNYGNSLVPSVIGSSYPSKTVFGAPSGPNWPGISDNVYNFITASLDDIGIWTRALTQQEITNLYNASLPPPCPTLPSNLQTGLVGYWPFCGNANDESGNGNHGTVSGASLTIDRFGDSGRAYSFDGINDNILVSHNSILNTLPITISAWFNGGSITNRSQFLVNKYPCLSNNGYSLHLNEGHPSAFYFSGSGQSNYINMDAFSSTLPSLTANNWHNLCVSINANDLKYYLDGRLIFSTPFISNQGYVISTVENLYFGKYPQSVCGGSNDNYYTLGSLDDICIWNRALDSTEIAQLYQTQSTPSEDGKIGVNIASPQRSLHIKDVIRLEPRNSAPDNPVKGDMYYDGILNKLRVYDGTAWQNCW